MKRVSGYESKTFSRQALDAVVKYEWPGNIRELENLIERLSVLVENPVIELSDLPENIVQNTRQHASVSIAQVLNNNIGFAEAVDHYQRSLIEHALNETGWVKARAAELLKMNRTTLVEKIKKMDIQPETQMPVF